MIKRGQQFKVDTIKELKEAYKHLKFLHPLKEEIRDFECEGMRYISLGGDKFILYHYNEDLETIPNPFKKSKTDSTGIDKAMDDLSNEAKKLGFSVEVVFKNLEK